MDASILLNDIQSHLNETRVANVLRPTSVAEVATIVGLARRTGRAISVSGGRHAMGTQQFGTDTLHIDITGLDRVLELDVNAGLVTVEAGIMWPALIAELHRRRLDDPRPWTIREKQTGVDDVTIAGSLAANMHGRSLARPPFVTDVEAFELIDAQGRLVTCSRTENAELFRLAIGGYGLFGIIVRVTLRLERRFKARRDVRIIQVADLLDGYRERVAAGYRFGDCQYSIDLTCEPESHPGVFACYRPVDDETLVTSQPAELSRQDWADLYRLIRTDKSAAFRRYADHYRRTDGQIYWSDTLQLAGNFSGHRAAVEATRGTEMITEAYVPHDRLIPFMRAVRDDLHESQADVSYGTVRFIEPDRETFLPWARDRWACIVCNLFVRRTEAGIANAARDFRRIIDRAIEHGGSYYLTYHRWATPEQLEACHPRIREFFRAKREYDPDGIFQSEWYRQYAADLG
jgi:FAD/FMN-containing dehydrogenase